MPKRKPGEKIERFQPDRLAIWAAEMRDHTAIWILRNTANIAKFYEARDQLMRANGKQAPDDRLADIMAPLYALAAAVDHEASRLLATPRLDDMQLTLAASSLYRIDIQGLRDPSCPSRSGPRRKPRAW
jgi:hypothetical protein